MNYVQIVFPVEIEAARRGELGDADFYRDREVWVPRDILEAWRADRARTFDSRIPTLTHEVNP
jgi:hypothetical protein